MAEIIQNIDTNLEWENATLTDVVAVNDSLELANNPALSFDGVNDYVGVSPTSENQIVGSLTLELTLKCNDLTSDQFFFDNYDNQSGNLIYIKTDGTLGFHGRNGSGTYFALESSSGFISTNTIYKLAFVSNGTDWIVYSNGVEVARLTGVGGVDWNNTSTREIGARTASGYFNGIIDEVRIWNTARTQTEIQDNMNKELTGTETGLVAYYKMNEGSGTTLIDSAGTNDGTIYGSSWDNTSYYKWNGSRVQIIDTTSLDTVSSSTVSWTETLNSQIITVESSIDGGATWQICTNGSAIPNLNGKNVNEVQLRQSLSTSDNTVTPIMNTFSVSINRNVGTNNSAGINYNVKIINSAKVNYSIGINNSAVVNYDIVAQPTEIEITVDFSAQSNYDLLLEDVLDIDFISTSELSALIEVRVAGIEIAPEFISSTSGEISFVKGLGIDFNSQSEFTFGSILKTSYLFSSRSNFDLHLETGLNVNYESQSNYENIIDSTITINYSSESVLDSSIYYDRELFDSILLEAESQLDLLLQAISLDETVIILSPDLELVAFLENYTDLVWNRRWRKVDDFELSISRSKEVSRFLQPDNYIAVKNGDIYHAGRIKKRDLKADEQGERLTVRGKGLGEIFENRIAFNAVNTGDGYDTFTGPGEDAMKYYVEVNVINPDDPDRAVANLKTTTPHNKGAEINYRARFQKISEILYEISKTTGLGWDITLDLSNKEFDFEVLKAKINKAVRLDPNFDSVKMVRFEEDNSEMETNILIAGQGSGSDRMIRTVSRDEV